VAVDGDRVAGFLVSRPLGLGEGELLNLAVEPGFRRNGVGKALLQAFLAEFSGGAYLEVRESNAAALYLYKSLGFKEVTRRPGYYQSPPDAAIVMKFHSC
jgi:ribosomal-protein-alanine N-acetyltransferase